MTGILVALVVVLVFAIVFLAARATELLGVLKGEGETTDSSNLTNSIILVSFLVLGLIAALWSYLAYEDTYLLGGSASAHGVIIDQMFIWTSIICLIVFVVTQVLLFWFVFKYRSRQGHKAYFFSHDNKLEIVWTVIPAIVLTVLVAYGIDTWYKITGTAPKEARVVEVTAQQFNWLVRYPGQDGKLGDREFQLTSGDNTLGIDWKDAKSHDDFMPSEIHMEVGKPILFKLGAKDVLHSFYLPHFRVKMDCVPGIPTQFWFNPTITTDSMRILKNNAKFDYELACAELCGSSHWNMRFKVVVDSHEQYQKWLAEQQPIYKPEGSEDAPADSTKTGPAAPTEASTHTSEVRH
ncbi:MAG: cytochrome c oxidase subunit II [Chitinophagales bacterium]|nr:cytochrome c oxidase subunit II [Chitinophagales bacterium]